MGALFDHTDTNRRSWNTIAHARQPESAEFFRNGGHTLDDVEIEALPEVAGKRMAHLACACGNESLSWAVRGAEVTGIDISDVAIGMATANADAAGLSASFVAADMFALPPDLGTFDIVYASWGVVCWVPDLHRWCRIVADLLEPGGTFVLCEHHPVWEVLGVRPHGVEVTVDYFGRSEPTRQVYDQAKRPSGSTPGTEFDAFVWPVSDVVMAVAGAGLRIERFTEHPVQHMYDGLDRSAAWLPATYVIKAIRP